MTKMLTTLTILTVLTILTIYDNPTSRITLSVRPSITEKDRIVLANAYDANIITNVRCMGHTP